MKENLSMMNKFWSNTLFSGASYSTIVFGNAFYSNMLTSRFSTTTSSKFLNRKTIKTTKSNQKIYIGAIILLN
jgi:hypothetical protein